MRAVCGSVGRFNEAAARGGGKEELCSRGLAAIKCFNEAAARGGGKGFLQQLRQFPTRRFNEAAARGGGKAGPEPSGSHRRIASMRPPHAAAEKPRAQRPPRRAGGSFNEAAARGGGKARWPPLRQRPPRRFNEAAARGGGKGQDFAGEPAPWRASMRPPHAAAEKT